MEPTKEQRQVIDNRGHGLLVSAAAGAGKTWVLVERLFSRVENEDANLDDFLIITFTNAAAAELRAKIAKRLNEKIAEKPNDPHLRRQLMHIYRADIGTIDAFCGALLRENCHLLPEDDEHRALRPDFRIPDTQEITAIRERAMRRALERFYEDMDAGKAALIELLDIDTDDEPLRTLTENIYDKTQAHAYPESWLAEQKGKWLSDDADDPTGAKKTILAHLKAQVRSYERRMRKEIEAFSADPVLREKYTADFTALADGFAHFAEATDAGWNAARQAAEIDFPDIPRLKKADQYDPARKEHAHNTRKDVRDSFRKLAKELHFTEAEIAEQRAQDAPIIAALIDLTLAFGKEFLLEKRRRNVAEFNDLEHETVRLLADENGAPTPLALTLAARYREVLVDEYQDTNGVQNCIFNAITSDGKTLFTVGDVKQSIYRFRLADPTIFLDHYRRFPDAEQAGEDDPSVRILLNRNFRSRPEVIDAANFVFERILSREMGGMEYGDAERLYQGAEFLPRSDCETEFYLLKTDAEEPTEENEEADERSTAQKEAAFVAERIRRMIDGGFGIEDKEGEHPACESDFAILLPTKSHFNVFRRALEARNLRVAASDSEEDLFSATETVTLFAFLSLIDNPRQDVALISVLRSPLFGFSPSRLAQVRSHGKGELYDALCADEGEDAKHFLAMLARLREAAKHLTLHRLFSVLCDTCGADAVFGAMPDGQRRLENIASFAGLVAEYEQRGRQGLFSFVSGLRDSFEMNRGEMPVKRTGSGDGVQIATIHKSKGLEYPVVFLAGLSGKFNDTDELGKVLLHPQLGIGIEHADFKRRIVYDGMEKRAIKIKIRKENREERMRLLYVAMTRAKQKMILTYATKQAESEIKSLLKGLGGANEPVDPALLEGCRNMGQWVLLPLLLRAEAAPLRALAEEVMENPTEMNDSRWRVEVKTPGTEAPSAAIGTFTDAASEEGDLSALEYEYPYKAETQLPAKVTATQLKGRDSDAEISENAALHPRRRTITAPKFIAGERGLTAAERGTAIHAVMQFLDFSCEATEDAVRAEVGAMEAKHLITPQQAEAVDCAAIAAFLQSPVGRRVRNGKNVRREYRFSVLRAASELFAEATSEDEVLFQGVIDCFWEEDGALVVLDFKTDHIRKAEAAERAEVYRPQVEAYAEAIGKILEMPVREKLLYFFTPGTDVTL